VKPISQAIKEQGQLLRLRQLREDAAVQQRDAIQRELDRLLALRAEHEQRWHALCDQRRCMGQWAEHVGASGIIHLNPYASARRADLDELCERAEYDVIDDDDLIAKARARLTDANQAWVRACAQRQAIEEMLQVRRRRARIEADLKQERDAA
jgi:hypothetical protein